MSHFSRKVDHPLARTWAISGWVEKPAGATLRRGPGTSPYTPPCAISLAHPTIPTISQYRLGYLAQFPQKIQDAGTENLQTGSPI
jgi:hypothetical protein